MPHSVPSSRSHSFFYITDGLVDLICTVFWRFWEMMILALPLSITADGGRCSYHGLEFYYYYYYYNYYYYYYFVIVIIVMIILIITVFIITGSRRACHLFCTPDLDVRPKLNRSTKLGKPMRFHFHSNYNILKGGPAPRWPVYSIFKSKVLHHQTVNKHEKD